MDSLQRSQPLAQSRSHTLSEMYCETSRIRILGSRHPSLHSLPEHGEDIGTLDPLTFWCLRWHTFPEEIQLYGTSFIPIAWGT